MKTFEAPEIKRFPLVVKDQITLSLNNSFDGRVEGSELPGDDFDSN
jgi:hypothetical protein